MDQKGETDEKAWMGDRGDGAGGGDGVGDGMTKDEQLNETNRTLLRAIAAQLDGADWDADTCAEIAILLRTAGFIVCDPDGDVEDES
jgi:hypothetical protein